MLRKATWWLFLNACSLFLSMNHFAWRHSSQIQRRRKFLLVIDLPIQKAETYSLLSSTLYKELEENGGNHRVTSPTASPLPPKYSSQADQFPSHDAPRFCHGRRCDTGSRCVGRPHAWGEVLLLRLARRARGVQIALERQRLLLPSGRVSRRATSEEGVSRAQTLGGV